MVYLGPDKAKPFVRRGRKAAGLFREKDGRAAEGTDFGKPGLSILALLLEVGDMKEGESLSDEVYCEKENEKRSS